MSTMTLGIVLAAGGGQRYGEPKVTAANGYWLECAVNALAGGGISKILVALGAAVVPVPAPAAPLVVTDWRRGLSATVTAAVHAAQADADVQTLVLHTVDTPTIDAAVVERVLTTGRSGLVRAVYHGRPGHPVLIARRYWDELLQNLSGDTGAGPFLASQPDLVRVECSDLAGGEDIDEE
jgi:CTP:molybdopterin cytidylyltransferase MocA